MNIIESTNRTSWFAVRVKTTHEKRVTAAMDYQGREWFLPLYRARRRWSDRIKQMDLPLFPGYVFSRFPQCDRASVLKIPSVMRIVGVGYVPIPIDEQEIAALQKAVYTGAGVSPHPFLRVGQKVRIEAGALYGLEGLILDMRRPTRLIVSITLLQRSVAVEIDGACVSRIYSEPKTTNSNLNSSSHQCLKPLPA